jgi:hypothetical protein
LAALLVLALPAVAEGAPGDRVIPPSMLSWTMDAELCQEPGIGPFHMSLNGTVAHLQGWATCGVYQHGVNYTVEVTPTEDGYVFAWDTARMHLDRQGRLVEFAELNLLLGFWVTFHPAG